MLGVTNSLLNRFDIERRSESYGKALEQFVCLELRAFIDYRQKRTSLCYWRSTSQMEVDFILGDRIAIEVKSKERVSHRDIKGLFALSEEITLERKIVVCHEPLRRVDRDGIEYIPAEEFFGDLWAGKIA